MAEEFNCPTGVMRLGVARRLAGETVEPLVRELGVDSSVERFNGPTQREDFGCRSLMGWVGRLSPPRRGEFGCRTHCGQGGFKSLGGELDVVGFPIELEVGLAGTPEVAQDLFGRDSQGGVVAVEL